ncbi:MAG: FAD-dependent oxidoreductase [Candidatus Omnitrophica bacterium]|nr:FAD-dependent oxidoreductase [Candidatus Omnitrophota bacterium]
MPSKLKVKIKEVIQRTYNVKSFRVQVPQEIDFKAGQFLKVSIKEGSEFTRYLSISNSPTEKGYLEFTKKITQSLFSKTLDTLKTQDTLRIQYPFGKFTLDEAGLKVTFLSGGIGITPIRSMVKYAVDMNLGIEMILLYANRSIKDVVFKDDFEAMQKAYSKLKVVHLLSEPAPNFKSTPGLINARVIRNEIPDFLERKFYLCGAPQMVEAMRKILSEELSLPNENIITENFQGY